MKQMLGVMTLLCLFMSSEMFANSVPAQASYPGEQDFAKGGDLLKQKQ